MYIRTRDKETVINTELVTRIYVDYRHTKILVETNEGQFFSLGCYPKETVMDAFERLLNAISEDRRYYEM